MLAIALCHMPIPAVGQKNRLLFKELTTGKLAKPAVRVTRVAAGEWRHQQKSNPFLEVLPFWPNTYVLGSRQFK